MRQLPLLNLFAFAAVLAVNYLSNSLPLNGKTPAQLSDQYPNLFVPAGLTFAIWGVIYAWLLVWIGYQTAGLFRPKIRAQVEPALQKIGGWFALTCLLNISWLFAWHWEKLLLSVAIMCALMAALWRLNTLAGTGISKTNQLEKWLAHAPFGLYQGWITIALIANVTALLVAHGWQGGDIPEYLWAIFLVLAGTLLANMVVRKTDNVFHGLAVAWALLGIFLQRSNEGDSAGVAVGRIALLSAVLVLMWVTLRWKRWLAY